MTAHQGWKCWDSAKEKATQTLILQCHPWRSLWKKISAGGTQRQHVRRGGKKESVWSAASFYTRKSTQIVDWGQNLDFLYVNVVIISKCTIFAGKDKPWKCHQYQYCVNIISSDGLLIYFFLRAFSSIVAPAVQPIADEYKKRKGTTCGN